MANPATPAAVEHACSDRTRAYDFIRMAAISEANIRLCGFHAGVEIGADGPSQMALEDLAMMQAVYGSAVLNPSDATSSSWPRTTTRPAASAARCSKRSTTQVTPFRSSTWRSAACPLRNPQEFVEAAGISPGHIAQAARDLLRA